MSEHAREDGGGAARAGSRAPSPRAPLPPLELPQVYRDARHYDFLATFTAPDDLRWYRHLVERFGGPVLELGCGTGRICLPLAEEGVEVTGLDVSDELLAHARLKARAQRSAVELLSGDFRDFALGRTFPLILLPYNAFNHLLDLASIQSCFAAVQAHMDAESRFVIDTFQPSLSFLGDQRAERRRIGGYIDPDGRGRVEMMERNQYDPATQINRVRWHYEIDGRPDAQVDELLMRIVFPQELDALLVLGGFAIEEKWGDYDQSPFGSTSPKQLMLCRRATAP